MSKKLTAARKAYVQALVEATLSKQVLHYAADSATLNLVEDAEYQLARDGKAKRASKADIREAKEAAAEALSDGDIGDEVQQEMDDLSAEFFQAFEKAVVSRLSAKQVQTAVRLTKKARRDGLFGTLYEVEWVGDPAHPESKELERACRRANGW